MTQTENTNFTSPLAIHAPDTYGSDEQWTVAGDLREIVDFADESTNYVVRDGLAAEGFATKDLDPEYSCFFAYADTEAAAVTLRDAALRLALKAGGCNSAAEWEAAYAAQVELDGQDGR